MGRVLHVSEVDWEQFEAVDICTLVFVVDGPRVLLIRKKRGLGAGKINGPGGKLEAAETPLQCAVRETREEVGLDVRDLEPSGELTFLFADGYSTHVHVFRTGSYSGTPAETEEAIPLWHKLDAMPYDEMWEDDRLWLPMLFARQPFRGHFLFDGDEMVDYELGPADPAGSSDRVSHPR